MLQQASLAHCAEHEKARSPSGAAGAGPLGHVDPFPQCCLQTSNVQHGEHSGRRGITLHFINDAMSRKLIFTAAVQNPRSGVSPVGFKSQPCHALAV